MLVTCTCMWRLVSWAEHVYRIRQCCSARCAHQKARVRRQDGAVHLLAPALGQRKDGRGIMGPACGPGKPGERNRLLLAWRVGAYLPHAPAPCPCQWEPASQGLQPHRGQSPWEEGCLKQPQTVTGPTHLARTVAPIVADTDERLLQCPNTAFASWRSLLKDSTGTVGGWFTWRGCRLTRLPTGWPALLPPPLLPPARARAPPRLRLCAEVQRMHALHSCAACQRCLCASRKAPAAAARCRRPPQLHPPSCILPAASTRNMLCARLCSPCPVAAARLTE